VDAYYTAAGKLPFCDGQPATDKTWAQLYVQLVGRSNTGSVGTILG